MGTFVKAIAAVMEPHLARHGGPIIMAQIENELHSPPGDPYVAWCGALAASLGLDIPWVMCNGASANTTVNTCNGNSCGADAGYADTHAALFPGQPMGWTEDWSWFTTWGGEVTDHPAPYMALNVAQWIAKGGAHHNYYMYYGGNHIESWAASGLTNRYGDGSNLRSDTLPNEPKRSHLAAMHMALATMNDALMAAAVQTRNSAVAVAPCPPVVPRPPGHRGPVCVDGTNGTGAVSCNAAAADQQFVFTGAANTSGTIVQQQQQQQQQHHGASIGPPALCLSGACPNVQAAGCAPLPMVHCSAADPAQQWTWELAGDGSTAWLKNAASGGCLASWSAAAFLFYFLAAGRHCILGNLTRISSPKPPRTRRSTCSILCPCLCTCEMLIKACNPMLCPIRVVRQARDPRGPRLVPACRRRQLLHRVGCRGV